MWGRNLSVLAITCREILRSDLLGHFFCLCPTLQHLVQMLRCSINAISSSWVGVHASSSLAPCLGPFLGVSGSGRCCGDGVHGCCSSDPKKVVRLGAVAMGVSSNLGNDPVTVKLPEGAGIGVATVAGEAGVADFVAEAEAELEASVFSALAGETSDSFFCFFLVLSESPIFLQGFVNAPTFCFFRLFAGLFEAS